jgi:hypothetical protein
VRVRISTVVSGMMGASMQEDNATLYKLLKVALSVAALLAILGWLVAACVRALRTWAREFWPH